MERIRAVYPLPSDDQTSEQGQDERSLGGPSDPLDPQEAPSEAPQSHRVNPLSSQEEAPAGSHPMGLMGHRGLHTLVCHHTPRLLRRAFPRLGSLTRFVISVVLVVPPKRHSHSLEFS